VLLSWTPLTLHLQVMFSQVLVDHMPCELVEKLQQLQLGLSIGYGIEWHPSAIWVTPLWRLSVTMYSCLAECEIAKSELCSARYCPGGALCNCWLDNSWCRYPWDTTWFLVGAQHQLSTILHCTLRFSLCMHLHFSTSTASSDSVIHAQYDGLGCETRLQYLKSKCRQGRENEHKYESKHSM
jgi:hypothetical protein